MHAVAGEQQSDALPELLGLAWQQLLAAHVVEPCWQYQQRQIPGRTGQQHPHSLKALTEQEDLGHLLLGCFEKVLCLSDVEQHEGLGARLGRWPGYS